MVSGVVDAAVVGSDVDVCGPDSASGVISGASGGELSTDSPTVERTAMAVAVTAALVSTRRSTFGAILRKPSP
ncbi:hypothetical protein NCCP2495_04090 [Dietzia sp. NCCP-2495]|nr:hypothetical protein NCCP2495_04090 [Dietzia sp. NCCP-2495]